MVNRILGALCTAALVATLSTSASASTMVNGFTVGLGVTEGNKQNRRTVVGTDDQDKDAGTIKLGALGSGDMIGIYGRIVSAVDVFEFEFIATSAFRILFDTNGYDVYHRGKNDDHGINSVLASQSGFINQSDVDGETKGNGGIADGAKEVKFSLREKVGGTWEHVFRTTNIVGDDTDPFADVAGGLLFKGAASGIYQLRIDGQGNGIAALYDINIQAVPLPAGVLLMLTGVAGLGLTRRRKRA